MHNWRPYIWRAFVKDWSTHWWWWFSKLCRLTSQKPLLLWPIYWKCKAGPPGHCSQSWRTLLGTSRLGLPSLLWENPGESKSLWSRQQCLIVRRVLSTTVFYCESQSRGKHCPTEVKYAAASPKSLKNRFGTAMLFIRQPALDREQSEQYSGKVFWKRFYSVLTN